MSKKAKWRISKRMFQENTAGRIFWKTNISYPLTRTYVCVLGGKKCSVFGKIGALCFLEISVLRLALLPYYRRKWVANLKLIIIDFWLTTLGCTAQKMKFSIEDFFSKCDQIRNFLRISSHLLKRSFMENFIFSAVLVNYKVPGFMRQLSKSCDIIVHQVSRRYELRFQSYIQKCSLAVPITLIMRSQLLKLMEWFRI